MAKKAQPKVSDLIESLLQEMEQFKGVINDRNKTLIDSISKINNLNEEFSFKRLEAIQKSNKEDIVHYFETQSRKSNEALITRLKNTQSSKILYLFLLNVLFLLTIGIFLFVLRSKSDYNTKYSTTEMEMEYSNNFKKYLTENPETANHFKEWLKN